jgi:hypothetical protein
VIKRQFGYTKVRYRGLAKNTAQIVTLFALGNLWMARRRLIAAAGMSAARRARRTNSRTALIARMTGFPAPSRHQFTSNSTSQRVVQTFLRVGCPKVARHVPRLC